MYNMPFTTNIYIHLYYFIAVQRQDSSGSGDTVILSDSQTNAAIESSLDESSITATSTPVTKSKEKETPDYPSDIEDCLENVKSNGNVVKLHIHTCDYTCYFTATANLRNTFGMND